MHCTCPHLTQSGHPVGPASSRLHVEIAYDPASEPRGGGDGGDANSYVCSWRGSGMAMRGASAVRDSGDPISRQLDSAHLYADRLRALREGLKRLAMSRARV